MKNPRMIIWLLTSFLCTTHCCLAVDHWVVTEKLGQTNAVIITPRPVVVPPRPIRPIFRLHASAPPVMARVEEPVPEIWAFYPSWCAACTGKWNALKARGAKEVNGDLVMEENGYRLVAKRKNAHFNTKTYPVYYDPVTSNFHSSLDTIRHLVSNSPGYPSYPAKGSHWSHPGNSKQALINHLMDGQHAGKFSRGQLETLSYSQLERLHSDDHDGSVQWALITRRNAVGPMPAPYEAGVVENKAAIDKIISDLLNMPTATGDANLRGPAKTETFGDITLEFKPTAVKWDFQGATKTATFSQPYPMLKAWSLYVSCLGMSYDGNRVTLQLKGLPDWHFTVKS